MSSNENSASPLSESCPPAPVPPAPVPPAPAPAPPVQAGVQNALTLIMPIKSPEDFAQLNAQLTGIQSLPPASNPLAQALTATHMVHFARFVFLENNTKLGVITAYDGSLSAYVNAFIDKVGQIFDMLLVHMTDAPPLPVEQHRDEFLAYVQAHDVPIVPPFYSAYPTLTVLDIVAQSE